jgi:hypothetical protein
MGQANECRVNGIRGNVLRTALAYIDRTPFMFDQWCGSFALKVLHDCGLGLHIPLIDGGSGARLCESLDSTQCPQVGDIVKMGPHYAIYVGMAYSGRYSNRLAISNLMSDVDLVTVDGGTFLDTVYMGRRRLHPNTLFYSIERLLCQKQPV